MRGGVEGPAGTANAAPLFTVVRIAVPLFKAGRTGAANVPPLMRNCSARAYSTYAWASTVKLILKLRPLFNHVHGLVRANYYFNAVPLFCKLHRPCNCGEWVECMVVASGCGEQ